MRRKLLTLVPVIAIGLSLVFPLSGCSGPKNKEVILATTTSTQDTGLLDVLKPAFEKKTGYLLKVVAVGSGQALAMGQKGEADVLLVHAPDAEKKLVESGEVINRRLVMHNDFIIVGPTSDPAGIKGLKQASEAFTKIAQGESVFVSRGDDSGTHKKEQEIWKKAGLKPEGSWYLSAGAGMGQTLRIASEKSGYTLTDRGTFLAQRNSLSLEVLVEGDPILLNIYHVMEVNPKKFNKINAAGGKAFADFMVSPEVQKLIGEFGVDKFGAPLFTPDAGKKEFD